MNKDLEKQIEISADKFADSEWRYSNGYIVAEAVKQYFIIGAKSEAAKQYWKAFFDSEKSETEKHLDEYIKNNFDGKPSYSEEEVRVLLNQCNTLSNSIVGFNEQDWFEQNKKK